MSINAIGLFLQIIFLLVVAIMMIVTPWLFLSYAMSYTISEKGILVVLFRKITVNVLEYSNISNIRKITSGEMIDRLTDSDNMLNSLWKTEVVLIEKIRWNKVKYVLYSPNNPDVFMEEVLSHLMS